MEHTTTNIRIKGSQSLSSTDGSSIVTILLREQKQFSVFIHRRIVLQRNTICTSDYIDIVRSYK